ncbi:O-antigen translocase [Pontimicrobium sp. IMCC45349]|uniref:O-antigen translocase n=1 Tax=Pontimicrobium sp. IMCC45349 TaxID=3391574 RepID=UPI0039A3A8BD
MVKLKNYIANNILIRIASLNSVSVFTKIISGLLTSKAIAFFVGAEGLALLGNLRNFMSSIQSLSILGLSKGTVKYIAEFKSNNEELSKLVSTIYILSFLVTIIMSFYCYFNSISISEAIFAGNNQYDYIIKVFAVALPFYASNAFLISVLNGLTKFKKVLLINILSQIIGVSITLFLILNYSINGALISLVLIPVVLFLITLFWVSDFKGVVKLISVNNVSARHLKSLSAFSMMALFSAIVIPLVLLYIRLYIIENIGESYAGFWEAITRISKYYLMFVTSLLALYILPKFSILKTDREFKNEVFKFYKTIIPFFGLGLVIIYFLREYIIRFVFTKEFLPVQDLFLWQLVGDFFKVLSLVIAYQFFAKKMFWYYLLTELFSVVVLYILSIVLIDIYGLKGVTMAHALSYLLYYLLILLIFRKKLFS